jgi:hypothetical protein
MPAQSSESAGVADVSIKVVSAPTCPIEAAPPDPSCAPRPLAGATILVIDLAGSEVARGSSNASGMISFALPPGTYSLSPQLLGDKMFRAPKGQTITVGATADSVQNITFTYDSGIR